MNADYVKISSENIQKSIDLLQEAGEQECVLLWLGRREGDMQTIVDVYQPEQIGTIDYFEIPRSGMAGLMTRLRTHGLYVVSQVHTHPQDAFHSATDDRWAIVRHVGALSIVLPRFAVSTTLENFLEQAAVFELDESNSWNQVASELVPAKLRIAP